MSSPKGHDSEKRRRGVRRALRDFLRRRGRGSRRPPASNLKADGGRRGSLAGRARAAGGDVERRDADARPGMAAGEGDEE